MHRAFLVLLALFGWGWVQPFRWPASYVPTVVYGGVIRAAATEPDSYSFNPAVVEPGAWLEFYNAPSLIYRDWLESRSFRRPNGSFNLFFAKAIQEIVLEKEFNITLRRGWWWSDGTEITADDAITARVIQGDAKVEGNRFNCSEIDGDPVTYKKLGRYRYRILLPKPQVNALDNRPLA